MDFSVADISCCKQFCKEYFLLLIRRHFEKSKITTIPPTQNLHTCGFQESLRPQWHLYDCPLPTFTVSNRFPGFKIAVTKILFFLIFWKNFWKNVFETILNSGDGRGEWMTQNMKNKCGLSPVWLHNPGSGNTRRRFRLRLKKKIFRKFKKYFLESYYFSVYRISENKIPRKNSILKSIKILV